MGGWLLWVGGGRFPGGGDARGRFVVVDDAVLEGGLVLETLRGRGTRQLSGRGGKMGGVGGLAGR